MSCISKILEIKGDDPILIDGEIAIEGGGTYKGYEWLITFVKHGHRCGYVAISSDHPTYNSDEDYPDYDVHGGITFFDESRFSELTNGHKCADKWLGFDAAHYGDDANMETADKYFGETDWAKYVKNNPDLFIKNGTHKSYDYMQHECERLIDQLIEKSSKHYGYRTL